MTDVATLLKRGSPHAEPESLHIAGYDSGKTGLDAALQQHERGSSLIAVRALAEVAHTWGAVENGGPRRAEELALEASPAHAAAILADAQLTCQLASGTPVVQPVLVGADGDRFVVVDGRRRVVAARAANMLRLSRGERPITVPIKVQRGDKGLLTRAMAIGNEHRRQDGVLARAEAVAAVYDVMQDHGAVALDMGLSLSSARNLVALGHLLRDLSDDAAGALRSGEVKPARVYRIARSTMNLEAKDDAVLSLARAARAPKSRAKPMKPALQGLVQALQKHEADLPAAVKRALSVLLERAPGLGATE